MKNDDIKRIQKLAGINSDLSEALQLARDAETGLICVVSDHTDPKKAKKETFDNREKFKAAGFKWNPSKQIWFTKQENLDMASEMIAKLNKSEKYIQKLEDLQELIRAEPASKEKHAAEIAVEKYINDLATATDAAAASEELRKFNEWTIKFNKNRHNYSLNNLLLIYTQRPDATMVAGRRVWLKMGRVPVGEGVGIKIWARKDYVVKDADGNPVLNSNGEEQTYAHYSLVNVFDVSDTVPTKEGKGEIPPAPQWWGNNEPDETADELFDLVQQAAKSEGINVTQEHAHGGELGWSKGGHINISTNVRGADKVSTMVHEYAHELMHQKEKSKFYIGDEFIKDKTIKELQAEAVSYVVLKHYDIPVEHHSMYLALWKATGQKIQHHQNIIREVSLHIIGLIDKMAGFENKNETTESIVSEMINEVDAGVRMLELSGA